MLYVLLFKNGSSKALLKLLINLKKVMKGRNLKMYPQRDAMTKNLVSGESLWVFKYKVRKAVNKTATNYKLVIQGLKTHLFHLKLLQHIRDTWIEVCLRLRLQYTQVHLLNQKYF